MLHFSKNILFTTHSFRLTGRAPVNGLIMESNTGNMLGYPATTFAVIANRFHLNLYSNGKSFHLFTKKNLRLFCSSGSRITGQPG